MTPLEQIDYQQQVQAVRAQLDPQLFNQDWADGRALPLDQAIQYATEVSL
jgi:hypothetical protein